VTNNTATAVDIVLKLTGPTQEHIDAVSSVSVTVFPVNVTFGVTTPSSTYTLSAAELAALKTGVPQTVSVTNLVADQKYKIEVGMTGIDQPHYIGTKEFTTNAGVDITSFTATQVAGTDQVEFDWAVTNQSGINISKIEIKEGATVVASPSVGDVTTTISGVSRGDHAYTIEVSYTGSRTGVVTFSAAPLTVVSSGEFTLSFKDIAQSTATMTITPSSLSHANAIEAVSVMVTPKGGAALPIINLDSTQLATLNSGNPIDVALTGLVNATEYVVSVNVVGLDNIPTPLMISFTSAGPTFSMQPIATQTPDTADVVLT
jgi:hypothetical protein